jgi:lysophospholipase L1-like esterase
MFKQYTPFIMATLAAAVMSALSLNVSAATLSNSISDNSITVDANLNDWSSIASLGYESASLSDVNARADFLEGWLAHDSDNLYLAYRNNGDISSSSWWAWQVYIDTDGSESTGYKGVSNVGAEYLLQGRSVYKYTGSGSNWSWQYISGATGEQSGALAEFKIPRSAIGDPSKARVVFTGRNGPFTGDFSASGIDTYPKSFAPLSLHDDLLFRQSAIWQEVGGTQSMTLGSSASTGATQLQMSNTYSIIDDQLITYLSSNGEYYTAQVKSTSGQTITLASGLKAPISAGQNVWNFYENGSHPNEYGYRAIADFAIREIGISNLNNGRHVLIGDSWFDSPGVGERLNTRLANATIINQGIGGNSSTDVFNRFDADVTSQNPDYVWVIAGVNDYHRDVPTATYLASMQAIITKISSIGAEAMVFDSPVGQLFYGSDARTQLSHDYADGLSGGGEGYVDYEFGAGVTPPETGDVSNPKTININGNLSDWEGLQSFGADGNDISLTGARADILEAWMAHDDARFYMAYQNDGPIDESTWWPWQTYLDTDNDESTGYKVGNGVGANFIVQGRGLYRYIGSGSNWAWQYIATADNEVNGNIAELSFSRSDLNNPSSLTAIMKTRNGIFTSNYSDAGVDSYPNVGSGNFSYKFGDTTDPVDPTGPAFSNRVNDFSINLNGNLNDWSAVTSFGRDGDDITDANVQADWLETWAAHDSNNLYFAYENDGNISPISWPWQIYIDTDSNPNTGYKVTGSIGAEYILEGDDLRSYSGNGSNWSWDTYAVTGSATVGEFAEVAIPRSILNGLSDFRLIFRTSNQPFTGRFEASGVDYFPNNAATSDQGYFSYSMR